MLERIWQIVRKELIQTLREPRARGALLLPPVIQLLIFGYAVNLDVTQIRLAWNDGDRTEASRDVRAAFTASNRFQIVAVADESGGDRGGGKDVRWYLDRGRVDAAVRILPGFERRILRAEPASLQILVDGTNSNTAQLVASYATLIVATYSARAAADQQNARMMIAGGAGAVNMTLPRIDSRARVWFNPELKSRNYFVPGVVVNIIMMVTLMLTTLGIVREKEIGTMEQLMVTPVRPIELMIGKTVPFAMVGLFDLLLVTTAALLIFHIPFRGNALLLLGSSILFLFTSLGAGLFISTISHTQQQAMMSSFFFSMPAFMLSGFTFPIRNMPAVVRYATVLNPVRYFMEIVRGIFLKGVGLDVLWPQILALAVFGVAVLGFSALRFRKTLD